MPLQQANNEKSQQLLGAASAWIKTHGGFESYQSLVSYAVAEYCANLEGLTLYSYMVDKVLDTKKPNTK
jgi:hypothetical protein